MALSTALYIILVIPFHPFDYSPVKTNKIFLAALLSLGLSSTVFAQITPTTPTTPTTTPGTMPNTPTTTPGTGTMDTQPSSSGTMSTTPGTTNGSTYGNQTPTRSTNQGRRNMKTKNKMSKDNGKMKSRPMN